MKKSLKQAYNTIAKKYLTSRTKNEGLVGFQNREIEQPNMFKIVPKNLKNKRLLDIGCGPGIHLKKYIQRGAKSTGIDISNKMIFLAKEYCPKGKFYVGNANKLKFKNNYFDIVTSSLMLDHIKNLDKIIKEVNRVLKKGGLFIFSVPHPITYMFRKIEKNNVTLTNSYFNKSVLYFDIARSGEKFVDYPRIINDYFEVFIKNNLIIKEFIENEPKQSWKNKYRGLPKIYFKIPMMCFFKLEKK